ncbi:MAG: tungsten ABC transporter substrate-binding protein, partial [Burkholderiaceae bacterium]|nr:tungsten ABC transporter substrate-binding protein [Burkholderiaceae bacterium]
PHVNAADAQTFVDWITSPKGQSAIDTYKIKGESLFFANADAR